MSKVNLDPKYIIKLTVTLFLTCVVVAGVLGYVNSITSGPIAEATAKKTNEALSAVFGEVADPQFQEIEVTDAMAAAASAEGATLQNVYTVSDNGADAGYAVKIAASGSQSTIVMVVGVDDAGAVTGVSIVSQAETSGIGSKVMNNEALASGIGVLDQFAGKTAADQPLKVGGNVDAISGATVSSKGVTKGVNGALSAVSAVG